MSLDASNQLRITMCTRTLLEIKVPIVHKEVVLKEEMTIGRNRFGSRRESQGALDKHRQRTSVVLIDRDRAEWLVIETVSFLLLCCMHHCHSKFTSLMRFSGVQFHPQRRKPGDLYPSNMSRQSFDIPGRVNGCRHLQF